MNSKFNKIFIILLSLCGITLLGLLIYANFSIAPYISNIEITESKRFKDQVIFNVEVDNYFFKINKATWCLLSDKEEVPQKNDNEWVKAVNGYCSFTVESGDYFVYVKDKYGNINDVNSQSVEINKVIEIKTNKNTFYMWKGRTEKINYELVKLGNASDKVRFDSLNTDVATVSEDGVITGVGYGTTTVKVISEEGLENSVVVVVSSFITKPMINFKKDYIGCKQFSFDEANLIDEILFDRVNEAGYGTRAGVIAAARFLTLEFNYRVHYFAENGRLKNYAPYHHVDGEGRYYHKGLYLNESKFKDITASLVGPAMWGCNLKTFTNLPQYTYGHNYPNGLDCSGFVTWALLNGGFDVGDIGAGENSEQFDLDDLGTKVYITNELMNSGKVKVGDLIGNNGHMAILAGWDENNYYIAESLNTTAGVVISTVSRKNLVNNSIYDYIILMDDVYKSDGNYTNMW